MYVQGCPEEYSNLAGLRSHIRRKHPHECDEGAIESGLIENITDTADELPGVTPTIAQQESCITLPLKCSTALYGGGAKDYNKTSFVLMFTEEIIYNNLPSAIFQVKHTKVIGVQSQMLKFNLYFGLKLCERIFKITDNLSSTLQTSSPSAADAQHIASLTVSTLSSIRTDESFKAFYDLVEHLRTSDGVDAPSLPRKRKVSKCIDKKWVHWIFQLVS